MGHSGKDTYFRDLNIFIEQISGVAAIKGKKSARGHPQATTELTLEDKSMLKLGEG